LITGRRKCPYARPDSVSFIYSSNQSCTPLSSILTPVSFPVPYIAEILKQRVNNNKMESLESANTSAGYCPHVGLFGANLFTSDKESCRSSTSNSLMDSLSTTDSQSTLSTTSSPKAKQTPTNLPPIPLPAPPSSTTTTVTNGPTSAPCLDFEEDAAGDVARDESIESQSTLTTKQVAFENGFIEPEPVKLEIREEAPGDGPTLVNGDLEMKQLEPPGEVGDAAATPSSTGCSTTCTRESARSSKASIGSSKTKRRVACSQCKAKTNLWRCLGMDCGLVLCGARGKNHANLHYQVSLPHFQISF